MSKTLTLVGRTRSFFLIDTLPDFSFFTEEILTISFFGVIYKTFGVGSPVSAERKCMVLAVSS
jgi:hypothetical protein